MFPTEIQQDNNVLPFFKINRYDNFFKFAAELLVTGINYFYCKKINILLQPCYR